MWLIGDFLIAYAFYMCVYTIHTALETGLVELVSSGNTLLSSVYGLAAFWAFWVLSWYERHVIDLELG